MHILDVDRLEKEERQSLGMLISILRDTTSWFIYMFLIEWKEEENMILDADYISKTDPTITNLLFYFWFRFSLLSHLSFSDWPIRASSFIVPFNKFVHR